MKYKIKKPGGGTYIGKILLVLSGILLLVGELTNNLNYVGVLFILILSALVFFAVDLASWSSANNHPKSLSGLVIKSQWPGKYADSPWRWLSRRHRFPGTYFVIKDKYGDCYEFSLADFDNKWGDIVQGEQIEVNFSVSNIFKTVRINSIKRI